MNSQVNWMLQSSNHKIQNPNELNHHVPNNCCIYTQDDIENLLKEWVRLE